jgi:hypothetical protein
MSANPMELFTAYVGLNKLTDVERAGRPERRSRVRIQVHWPVLFFRSQPAEAVESLTQNLSSRGFYCFSKTPLTLGEVLACTIRVPAHDPSGKEMDRQLDCKVRVMRVEPTTDGLYGIACRIEDYHVARSESDRTH